MIKELQEFKCPLCRKPLASDEYQSAISELKNKVADTYVKQIEEKDACHVHELEEIDQNHKAAIETLTKKFEQENKTATTELEKAYQQQIDQVKNTYSQISEENRKQFNALKDEMQVNHKKELQERDKQLLDVREAQENLQKIAYNQGQAKGQVEIEKLKASVGERDIQLKRFEAEVESLKKELSQKQAELGGGIRGNGLILNSLQ